MTKSRCSKLDVDAVSYIVVEIISKIVILYNVVLMMIRRGSWHASILVDRKQRPSLIKQNTLDIVHAEGWNVWNLVSTSNVYLNKTELWTGKNKKQQITKTAKALWNGKYLYQQLRILSVGWGKSLLQSKNKTKKKKEKQNKSKKLKVFNQIYFASCLFANSSFEG